MAGYGIYEQHEFPAYKFQEYPKFVELKDGTHAIVNSHSEELLRLTEIKGSVPSDDPLLVERNTLAEEVARLREQLAAATAAKQPTPTPSPVSIGDKLASNSTK